MIIDAKTQKYDRQLRLWKAHGQAALESAHICLVNGNATGAEILKNLVLPGIGSFTVVDDKAVEGSDIGNNFFLTIDQLGQNRAKCVTELLQELNEDVAGYHVDENVDRLIENKPDFFQKFSMVIVSNLSPSSASLDPNTSSGSSNNSHEHGVNAGVSGGSNGEIAMEGSVLADGMNNRTLMKLANICWEANIPLVLVRTCGFFAYLRLVVPEHCVVESHPDSITDLRLDCPWPELHDYAMSQDFTKMDTMQHGHIPYIVILLQALDTWRKKYQLEPTALPKTSEQKDNFKQLVMAGKQTADEENFDEAYRQAYKAYSSSVNNIRGDTKRVFNDPQCLNITSKSTNFWIIARAIKDFVENEGNGLLPLPGTVPDMKADTTRYIALQQLYRAKSRKDFQLVRQRVHTLLQQTTKPIDSIPDHEIEVFCKYANHIKILRYPSLHQEYQLNTSKPESLSTNACLSDPDNAHLSLYCLFRSLDAFWETHKRFPGEHNEDVEEDIGLLKKVLGNVLSVLGLAHSAVPDELVHEFVRAGNSELHTIAAFMGGVVSQEIIKLITKQYVPLKGMMIFNGMRSSCGVYGFTPSP